jgi:hypothetical protein
VGEPQHASPVTASGATQTFAVRDAILEWTAKIDSQPPRPTRVPAVAVDGARTLTPYRVAGAVAVTLTVVLGSWHLMGRAMGSYPWGSADASQQRSLTQTAAPHALASHSPARAAEPQALVAQPLAPVAPALPAHGSPSKGSGATQTGAAASGKVSASPSPAAGAASQVTSGVGLRNARVHLTAEPPALVEVDAARVGRTPLLSFPLAPGPHEIVFVNEMLGEKLRTRLTLASAELQRVHADFTSATPQVYVR